MRATIYKSTGSWYAAKTPDGEIWQCRIAGKMKLDEEITSTNPVAVGDVVEIDIENEEQHTAIITEITSRNNYIIRSSPHTKYQKQIVAANIDQAVLIATLKDPKTSQGFIDRYLVSAAAYHVPAVIIFNKQDLYHPREMQRFHEWEMMYKKIDYPVLLASALREEGLEEVKNILKNKTTLFAGHSGVGKSTLINDLIPGINLKIQTVSDWSGKGIHTTTFSEMFELPFGGKIIDTPGIRELGIVDMDRTELSQYFLDMLPYLSDCRFNNCLHINEPGCAVKLAIEKGDINVARYESYLAMLSTMQEQTW